MSAKESFSAGQTREFYGDGDFFRLLQTTGPITVEFYFQGREVAEMVDIEAGYAESFAREQKRFDRIRIYSPTAQDVKWVTRDGSDVRYDRGAASITGSVDLNLATIEALEAPYTGSYANATAMAGATVQTIFTPGSNTGGIVLETAHFLTANAGSVPQCAFIAKASAPAGIADGDVILGPTWSGTSGTTHGGGQLPKKITIPAGKGLYFWCGVTESIGFRSANWRPW